MEPWKQTNLSSGSLTDSSSGISSSEVDETITMALRAVVRRLSTGAAADLEGAQLEASGEPDDFAEELAEWVADGLVTSDGVELTRDEFRRRLEALKARYAGQAVRLRISEAADLLETDVLNRV